MPRPARPTPPAAKDSLVVEVGSWFRASATGTGIIAIPLVFLLVVAALVAQHFLP